MEGEREAHRRNDRIVRWIQQQLVAAGAQGAVLGMSGGIDSSVVAALCQRAVGDQALGLILPCHSLAEDVEHAHRVARVMGVRTEEIDLSGLYDLIIGMVPHSGDLASANLKPRLRMLFLYYFANARNSLVVGTSNAAELAVGYFTKFGDGAADILPLGGLLKQEVREMAAALGIPKEIIEKPPSAGLWKGQTDEEEMGISYKELDGFLSGKEVSSQSAQRIRALRERSSHKRRTPVIFQDQ
jgi:NAD+ synthase